LRGGPVLIRWNLDPDTDHHSIASTRPSRFPAIRSVKHLAYIISGLVVTAAALVYAFWGVDIGHLADLLAGGSYLLLLPYWLFLFAFFWFTALRWALLLRPIGHYSSRQVASAMMIGFGANNVLPARVGEVIRAVVFARRYRRTHSGVLTTLALERVLDVVAILAFYLAASALIDPFPARIRAGSNLVALFLVIVGVGLTLFLRYPGAFERLWRLMTGRLSTRLMHWGEHLLHNVYAGLSSLKSPHLVVLVVAYSLLKWFASGAMAWLALRAYGIDVSLGVGFIVVAVSALAVTLPNAPGFFGAMQAAFVFALTPFGVSQESALAASVFFLLAQWVPVTLVGGLYFFTTAPSLREVQREVEEVEEELEHAMEEEPGPDSAG